MNTSPLSPQEHYILALDQGTTSSRAIVFDVHGAIVARAQKEFTQHFPQPGWVEHDAHEIWHSQLQVAQEALSQAGLSARQVAAIGITNQRETTLLWERATGQPVHRAIVWQDRRTAARCDALRLEGHATSIAEKTGLVLDAYFSATKLEWMLNHIPDARERAQRGELAFGTVDSWLIWNLTGGQVHATDVSNASRTMLWNIHTQQWDADLLALFDIPPCVLPQVRASSGDFGAATLLGGASIAGIAGDQQAATFGQGCWQAGMVKNTYGTGCFMLCNTGAQAVASRHSLLTTAAWQLPQQPSDANIDYAIDYALEGSVFMAGATVQWLRDGLGILERAQDVEALAASVPDNGGVMLVPAHTGLGAPHWDASARGAVLGLTRGSSKAHLARAALEGIAHQVADVLGAMQADMVQSQLALQELRVDGGASQNNLLMQLQADLLQLPVVRPTVTETTALGAAFLAGLAVGLWPSREAIAGFWQIDRCFEPRTGSRDWSLEQRARWQKAVEKAKGWA